MGMVADPRAGFRHAPARGRRPNADWASAGAQRVDPREAAGEEVRRVGDNLNTHPNGAFSAACAPERARADSTRMHVCSTPQPGSWLHGAAGALRCLTSPCLRARRLGALLARHTAIATGSETTNAKPRGGDGPFRIENARVQLKRLSPKMKA